MLNINHFPLQAHYLRAMSYPHPDTPGLPHPAITHRWGFVNHPIIIVGPTEHRPCLGFSSSSPYLAVQCDLFLPPALVPSPNAVAKARGVWQKTALFPGFFWHPFLSQSYQVGVTVKPWLGSLVIFVERCYSWVLVPSRPIQHLRR